MPQLKREPLQMDTLTVTAKNADKASEVRETARSMGFHCDPDDPEFVVSIGGDGTFLYAEREFPGIPKVLVRDSLICYKCHDEPLDEMLDIIRRGDGRIVEMMKLEGQTHNWANLATNEIGVRNVDPRHALRFRISVDGDPIDSVLIGDGIVCTTSFGSTGYFRSITGETIDEGIGLAFNNLTEPRPHCELSSEATIELTVVRGQGHLTADNAPDMEVIEEDDTLTIRSAQDHKARLVGHTGHAMS